MYAFESISSRAPRDFNVAIVACFYPPTTVAPTTAGLPQTTGAPGVTPGATPGATTEQPGAPATTTPALPPTTTTMNYCVEEKGMNQPLNIRPDQVTSNPPAEQTTPPGDINPTSTTPGLDFTTMNPQINVTLDQPATLTVIYVPVDRPNQPSTNVEEITVVLVYPDGTKSPSYSSVIPSSGATTTTTPATGVPAPASTTPSTTAVVPPSPQSPQVDLPPNTRVPAGTIVVITITATKDQSPPQDVCTCFSSRFLIMISEGEQEGA